MLTSSLHNFSYYRDPFVASLNSAKILQEPAQINQSSICIGSKSGDMQTMISGFSYSARKYDDWNLMFFPDLVEGV